MNHEERRERGTGRGRPSLDVVIDLAAYRQVEPGQPNSPSVGDDQSPPYDQRASVWSQLRSAQAAAAAGDYRSALRLLVPLITTSTLDERSRARTHAQIGSTLMELRQYDAAADHLSQAHNYYASRGGRRHRIVLEALVVSCCYIGEVDAAARYLAMYERHTANRATTSELKAIVHWARGNHRRARDYAESSVAISDDAHVAQLVLAQLDNRCGDHAEVIARWTDLAQSNDERLLREVAIAYEALGDLAAAYWCERTAADVAENRTLTLSMLGELIEADFGRFGARRNERDDDGTDADRVPADGARLAPADASETAMAVVQAEVDELHAVIDEATRQRPRGELAAHQLAAELEGYVTRMNQALEAARHPKPPARPATNDVDVRESSDTDRPQA